LKQQTREAMCNAAVRLVKAANYTNAGTVEFLVDMDERFYFIEMNARIQVEHPVTEFITGIDLIKMQILVAAGERLPFEQGDIKQTGHAIECRINAEDPEHNFRPCPGKIEKLIIPGGFGVRFDSHVYAGYTVSPTYDSMVGKLIVHQPTRNEAIKSMRRCLRELVIEGIKTSVPLQQRIIETNEFQSGKIDTSFIERKFNTGNRTIS
jgi:acetyl-CoA carboxylase biotin carboxylase subunit